MLYESVVTSDDIRQEASLVQLRKLQKLPNFSTYHESTLAELCITAPDVSKQIIRQKMGRKEKTYFLVDDLTNYSEGETAEDPTVIGSPITDEADSARTVLMEWALEQTTEVQKIISEFLLDPEGEITSVLTRLASQGIELHAETVLPKPKATKITYTDILRKALPATKEDMIRALSHYPIERPASTVRQFIRRHQAQLTQDAMGCYHLR